ncbi:MAG: hypothetical protein ACI396_01855 [Acutalibacteraceae bacterium]
MIRNKLIAVFVVFALLIGTLYCGCFITAAAETDNLLTGGEWVPGQYLANTGEYDSGSKDSGNSPYRIAYNKKIDVTTGKTYIFDIGSDDETKRFVIRYYKSDATLLQFEPSTTRNGEITMPEGVVQLGISIYDTDLTSGPNSSELLEMITDGTLNPTITESDEPIKTPASPITDNLLSGGNWVKGQYLSGSGTLDTALSDANSSYRIAYNKKIAVTPGKTYYFDVGNSSAKKKFVLRGFNSSGSCVTFTPSTTHGEEITIPSNVVQIGVSIYDTDMKSGPKASELLEMIYNGSLNPLITLSVDESIIEMASGAAMRIDGATYGIRFTATVDKAAFDEKVSGGKVTEIGTLIAKEGTNTDTVTVYNAVEVNDINTTVAYGQIPVAKYPSGIEMQVDDAASKYVIVGSLVEIKDANANQKYVARAYIKYTVDSTEYVMYADALSDARSIAEVAHNIVTANDGYYASLCTNHKKVVDYWANQYSE